MGLDALLVTYPVFMSPCGEGSFPLTQEKASFAFRDWPVMRQLLVSICSVMRSKFVFGVQHVVPVGFPSLL